MVMSQGKKIWCQVKDLIIRNTDMPYESPISSGLKVMTKVEVFKRRLK